MKPEPQELNVDNYRFRFDFQPRYSDLDPLGHVNNVAIADAFQESRTRFLMEAFADTEGAWSLETRLITASVVINYLEEVSYPAPLVIGVACFGTGRTSYTLSELIVQRDKPVACCRIVMVRVENDGPAPLTRDMKAGLARFNLRQSGSL